MRPLCFVLMAFGEEPDENGRIINFDIVYQDVIRPAIIVAEPAPIRADEDVARYATQRRIGSHVPDYWVMPLCWSWTFLRMTNLPPKTGC